MSSQKLPVIVIVVVVLGIFFAGVWLGNTAGKNAQLDEEVEKKSVGSNIERVIDEEARVVCWEKQDGDGDIECLPLNQTALAGDGS